MSSSLFKMDLPAETVKMKQVYKSDCLDNFALPAIACKKVEDVYGALKFETVHEDRPYTFTSLVTSIDGRIAFTDAPQGPLIARENRADPDGAMSDWWILNMLRAAADGIMVGAGTMCAEADFTGHIFDAELEDARVCAGRYAVPTNIITSLDGTDIPFDHVLFNTPEIPVMISTSAQAKDYIEQNIKNEYVLVGPLKSKDDLTAEHIATIKNANGKVVVLLTGDKFPDSHVALYALKKGGFDKLLVETPSYAHYLVGEQLMDEFFLNYSCVYLGGKALTIGQFGKEFTSKEHPHTRMLSIHAHSDSFFYFRHQLIYGK